MSLYLQRHVFTMWRLIFKKISPNGSDFMSARLCQLDTKSCEQTRQAVHVQPITGCDTQHLCQFVFPCSSSSSRNLLPLQQSCHVNLLSFSATWSSEGPPRLSGGARCEAQEKLWLDLRWVYVGLCNIIRWYLLSLHPSKWKIQEGAVI